MGPRSEADLAAALALAVADNEAGSMQLPKAEALLVRAGDRRVAARAAPPYPGSARVRRSIVVNRPTTDEDWALVIRYELG